MKLLLLLPTLLLILNGCSCTTSPSGPSAANQAEGEANPSDPDLNSTSALDIINAL